MGAQALYFSQSAEILNFPRACQVTEFSEILVPCGFERLEILQKQKNSRNKIKHWDPSISLQMDFTVYTHSFNISSMSGCSSDSQATLFISPLESETGLQGDEDDSSFSWGEDGHTRAMLLSRVGRIP
jgi:hypothetical protein